MKKVSLIQRATDGTLTNDVLELFSISLSLLKIGYKSSKTRSHYSSHRAPGIIVWKTRWITTCLQKDVK